MFAWDVLELEKEAIRQEKIERDEFYKKYYSRVRKIIEKRKAVLATK